MKTKRSEKDFIVNELGQVWSKQKKIWTFGTLHPLGYYFFGTYPVHRLVAIALVPNPNGYCEVNHIDGNKANNVPSNLEWCTRSQNMRHLSASPEGSVWKSNVRSRRQQNKIVRLFTGLPVTSDSRPKQSERMKEYWEDVKAGRRKR